jgi:CDP-glucose 4,6-dehydratase
VLEPLSGYLDLAAQLFADRSLRGESFNFGPPAGPNRTVLQLVGDLGAVWGHPSPASSYEVLERPPFSEAGLLLLSIDKARARLGWEPTLSYAETVRLTGEWYRGAHDAPERARALTETQIDAYEALATERSRAWRRAA